MNKPTLRYMFIVLLSLAVFTACAAPRKLSSLSASHHSTEAPNSTAPTAATPLPVSEAPAEGNAAQPAAPASPSAATKQGWWIRINPRTTTAPAIALQIGTDKLHREEWLVWRAGQPVEFDVPEKYSQAPRLYLRGNVSQIGKMADLCLMYKGRGVEHMGFDDDDSETKSQLAVDYKCRL